MAANHRRCKDPGGAQQQIVGVDIAVVQAFGQVD
jgi:hypothetical protein